MSLADKQVEESHGTEISSEQTDETSAVPAFKPSRFARSVLDNTMSVLTTALRRVRTGPGGPSSMANLWDDYVEAEPFKPTRRLVCCLVIFRVFLLSCI